MDTSNYQKNNNNSNYHKKIEKNLSLLKIAVILLCIMIICAISLPLFFSKEQIIEIIQAKYTEETGLKLDIASIDLQILNENIILHDVSSKTSSGETVGSIEKASLKMSAYDIYNLYMHNIINIDYLELTRIKFSDIPYLQIVKTISPKKWDEEYNLEIARILDNSKVDVEYVYLKQLSSDKIDFKVKGIFDGKYSGSGEINGSLSNFKYGDIRKIKINSHTSNFIFNINSKNQKSSYSGTFDYTNLNCDFNGVLITNKSPLKILNAKPETTYRGLGSWDIKNNSIKITDATISNKDGLMIKANGSIVNPTNQDKVIISANIIDSVAQLQSVYFEKINSSFKLNNGFKFKGKIIIAPDKLDIKGKINADNISLTSKNSTKISSNITADFTASRNSLILENIESFIEGARLTGNLSIPVKLLKKPYNSFYDYKDIEANLDLQGDLSDFAQKIQMLHNSTKPLFIPKGTMDFRIINQPQKIDSKFSITFGSNDNKTALYNETNNALYIGRFSGLINGTISSNNTIIINSFGVKSNPLDFSLKTELNATNSNLSIEYNITAKLNKILSFLNPRKLSDKIRVINKVNIEGSGNYNFNTYKFESELTKTKFYFDKRSSPSFLTFDGPISICTKENWPIMFKNTNINIFSSNIINNKSKVTCNAIFNGESSIYKETKPNHYDFSPHGSATIGIRSHDSTLLKLFSAIYETDELPYDAKETIVKSKINFNYNEIEFITKFLINNIAITKPVNFTAQSVEGNASLKYSIDDNKITINELKLFDPKKTYEYAAAGNIYLENAIFEGFTSKLTANIDDLFKHFKGYGVDRKFEGQIEILTELTGTSDSPSLTMVGKSDKIKTTRFGFSNTVSNIKFDAQLSWDREADGSIYGLNAKEIFLKSSNATMYIKGISERFQLEKNGIVNFGKGCNVDILLNGNRKLLSLLIPGYYYHGSETGNKKSISVSANISAQKLPLFSFETDLKKSYLSKTAISKGKINVDRFDYNGVTATNVTADFSLNNGIASLSNGKGKLYGDISFSSTANITDTPTGKFLINLSNVDLANALSRIPLSVPVLNGWLTLPTNSPTSSLEIFWNGDNFNSILKNIHTKREKAHIKDLLLETTTQQHDWEKFLSVDFPPSLATEIAKQINNKLSPTYGKKKKLLYNYCDIDYQAANGALRIYKAKCSGRNTADLLIKGIISYDGKIKLRIYPTGNLEKSFNIKSMLKFPTIDEYTKNLSPRDRAKFYQVIPSTLERLARDQKLSIDITGTIEKPEINIENLRAEIRKNLPEIISQFNQILGEGGILKLLLKNVQSDKIKNALSAHGEQSSLSSGSSLGDLLKFIE